MNKTKSSVHVYMRSTECCLVVPPPDVVWRRHNGFVLSVRACVRPCVRPEPLLARYIAEHLTHSHQTYINDALWDSDKRITIWVKRSKVKVTVVKPSVAVQAEAYSTRRLVSCATF